VLRFEAAALCGRESLIREIERREGVQGFAHAGELFCKPDGQRAECGRGALLRAHDGDRVLEQTPPLVVVLCDFEGGHQGQGLPALEPVALDGLRQGVLILGLEGAERVSEGGPDPAVVDETLERGGELLAEAEAAFHPIALSPAQPGDGGEAETVVVAQRRHHPGLIHGRQRPWRRVRQQDRHLLLGSRGGPLDDDRDFGQTSGLGAVETLEAVDHLEVSVLPRNDPKRQIHERLYPRRT